MRSKVLGYVTVLFLVDGSRLDGHAGPLILFHEVLVCALTGDKNHILVDIAEADLSADRVHRVVWDLLLSDAALLVNLPDVKGLLGLRAERRQKSIVFGAESHGHP